jgi:hypothetical protein
MRVEDFMENFVSQFQSIQQALAAACDDLNESCIPDGGRPLRLSKAEIANLVLQVGGFAPDEHPDTTAEDKRNESLIMEGLEELTEQLYLDQYADTLSNVMADFHRDMVMLIRLVPSLMLPLSPIIRQFKIETNSRLSSSRKFKKLLAATEALLESLDEDTPNYALRIIDEVADFSECMTVVTENLDRETPVPANDNMVAA